MLRLTREFRFFWPASGLEKRGPNSWSGSGGGLHVAPFLKLRATITGQVDAATGYLLNIQLIDQAIWKFLQNRSDAATAAPLDSLAFVRDTARIQESLPGSVQLLATELCMSPYLSLSLKLEKPVEVQLTEQFEFSAAHRLHCPTMSDEENRAYFGKCNNPAGHGHNYVVAVTIAAPGDSHGFSLESFESTVKSQVVDRLDHKHLNEDIEVFKALNPTVENIARVIWDWLANDLQPAILRNIRVYETPKTWVDYAGP